MKSRPLDRLSLTNLKRDEVVPMALLTLHHLQNETPERIVGGASLLFAALCHRLMLDPQEEHARAMRMLAHDEPHHDKTNKALQSLRDFAGLRVAGQEVSIS